MSTDVFSNFGALDELIQIIYQNIYRFVAISTVTDDKWTIRLGLASSEGRWWEGSWTETDVHQVLGSKTSDTILEQFAEKVAELLVGGELYISNTNPTPARNVTFTIGPATKNPLHVELKEMASADAAAFATTLFLDIALQAKARKGRLHGSSLSLPTFTSTTAPTSRTIAAERAPPIEETSSKTARTSVSGSSSHKAISAESSNSKASHHPPSKIPDREESKPKAEPKKRPAAAPAQKVPITRPHKGASLAHPNKKARKYEAVEFDSDDD